MLTDYLEWPLVDLGGAGHLQGLVGGQSEEGEQLAGRAAPPGVVHLGQRVVDGAVHRHDGLVYWLLYERVAHIRHAVYCRGKWDGVRKE